MTEHADLISNGRVFHILGELKLNAFSVLTKDGYGGHSSRK